MFLNTWTQLLSNSTSWAVLLEKENQICLLLNERYSVTIIITLKPYIATDVSYHNETDLFNCAENFPHSIHLWFITEGEI